MRKSCLERKSIEDIEGSILIGIGAGLNTKASKSQSWVIRFVRILLIKTSEMCWHSATFYKWHYRMLWASFVLIGLWGYFGNNIMWKEGRSKRGQNIRVGDPGPLDLKIFQGLWSGNSVLLLGQLDKDCSDLVEVETSEKLKKTE